MPCMRRTLHCRHSQSSPRRPLNSKDLRSCNPNRPRIHSYSRLRRHRAEPIQVGSTQWPRSSVVRWCGKEEVARSILRRSSKDWNVGTRKGSVTDQMVVGTVTRDKTLCRGRSRGLKGRQYKRTEEITHLLRSNQDPALAPLSLAPVAASPLSIDLSLYLS
jgi:hypothetical protein